MIGAPEIELAYAITDGEIAVNNLKSALQQSWSRFWRDPLQPGIAERVVEEEQCTLQFLGDPGALDRLETLINHLDRVDAESPRTALIHAQVASMGHRFADAKSYLAKAAVTTYLSAAANRLSLSIDQACGARLETVLKARQRMAAQSGRLEDLVPLGALHADLGEFDEADRVYQCALREYQGTSPFAVAWVCFQLGALWGELVSETQPDRAAQWYRKAIEYLPRYVKARVHLAEIYLSCGRTGEAEALLLLALSSGDPEVRWRLADVMAAVERFVDAEAHMQAARSGFEALLGKHLLAFADHGAEFYSGTGNDARRALELARVNVENRPTLRAFEQAYAAAVSAGEQPMNIDRRAFILGTAFCATAPALAKIPHLASPQAAADTMDTNSIVLKIHGWDQCDGMAIGCTKISPANSATSEPPDNQVWISINQSWKTAWR